MKPGGELERVCLVQRGPPATGGGVLGQLGAPWLGWGTALAYVKQWAGKGWQELVASSALLFLMQVSQVPFFPLPGTVRNISLE